MIEELKDRINDRSANSEDSDDEHDHAFAYDDVPTKCISRFAKVEVLCKLHFIDFEGRSDGESVKKMLERLQPRKLIIVHGNLASTKNLADWCVQNKVIEDGIHTPSVFESVDATCNGWNYLTFLIFPFQLNLELFKLN